MAKVQLVDPVPWGWSTADQQYLESLVATGLLAPNTDPALPVWIAPKSETTPNPLSGYVVSLARLHERGCGVPDGKFIRTLCHHYGVELHNFAPNAISQAESPLGPVEASLPGRALHRVRFGGSEEARPRRGPDAPAAGIEEGPLHPLQGDNQ